MFGWMTWALHNFKIVEMFIIKNKYEILSLQVF
jgi:hypothetical protein